MKRNSLEWIRAVLVVMVTCFFPCIHSLNGQIGFVPPDDNARDRLFDLGWLFYRGDARGAELANFNDEEWRKLDLPHDWSIEDVPVSEDNQSIGPFSKKSPGTFNTGYFMSGTGWYRKHFRLTKQEGLMQVAISFDGVFMNSEVWINGHYLGLHPNGYTPFYYDLKEYLQPAGEENILSVKVTNKGDNCRWYTGSGIYRHVYLHVTNAVHVARWGVYITNPKVSESQASIVLAISVRNITDKSATVIVRNKFFSPQGKDISETESQAVLEARSEKNVEQSAVVNSPMLWSDLSPSLYSAHTEIWKDGKLLDQTDTKFGIRSLVFDAEKGFLLNGKPTKLRGGCIHHDNGILGSVTFDRTEQRKLEILKANGFNAIRTSHNPPSKTLLDACDRLGMMVIDEAFDVWREPKVPDDFHLFFQEWWKKDLTAMIMRDRNHPSVIIWSVGNEIPEKDPKWFFSMADSLAKETKELDKTRPVTQAICCHSAYSRTNTQNIYSIFEVQGYNYERSNYEMDKKEYPNRIIVGTETFPKEAYENELQSKTHPWVIGDFVWTAFDYFGENGIGAAYILKKGDKAPAELATWPWFNSWCGDIDICGFKKPQSYFRNVVWDLSKLEMMVHQPIPSDSFELVRRWSWPNELPHWTWPGAEGKKLTVDVYTTYKEVRLEINGAPIATKKLEERGKPVISFEVPYSPGRLKAIAIENGREIAFKEYITAGNPVRLRLTADRTAISSNINDLAYIKVEMVDKDGVVVPVSGTSIRFSIEGSGELAAAGNGNPIDMRSFRNHKATTFNGKCLAVVRPNGRKGIVKLKAEADWLESSMLEISCK
jgi:beta-galactosidase